jgi:hypothetical protein
MFRIQDIQHTQRIQHIQKNHQPCGTGTGTGTGTGAGTGAGVGMAALEQVGARLSGVGRSLAVACWVALLAGTASWAQTPAPLSSPIPNAAPVGKGAGVHSPNSPFAALQERADVLPWGMLTAVKTKVEKNRLLPVFPAEVRALNKKSHRVQGFMMPLEPGEKHTHFLLSSVPLTCSFCTPGGPESMVEVKTKVPVKYVLESLVLEGQFAVLSDDPFGLYYRMTDAVVVK